MILFDLFTALLVALVAMSFLMLLTGSAREYGPSGTLLFVLLFLFVWAGGVWLAPIGPALGGVYVLGFVLVGLILTLLFAALAPPPRTLPPPDVQLESPEVVEARAQAESTEVAAVGFGLGVLFWVLVALLFFAALFSYYPFAPAPPAGL